MHRQLMRLALENAFVDVNNPSPEDALIMSFRKEFGHLYPTPPVVIEHNPIGRPYLAMEEIANGQPVKEIEHTIYAKVVSPSELERAASKENQEQWEIRVPKTDGNAGDGSMRVRKTWQDGKEEEATYVRTSKVKMNDQGDKIELPMPSNKDEFTVFKFLGSNGMRKVRFVFPIIGTNLKWEIDMFPKPDGEGFHEWCKIDLEVKDRNQPIPEFPIALTDVILPEGYGRPTGGNEEGQVRALYDQFFMMKNEFLKQPSQEPAIGSQQPENGGLNTSEQAALPNDPGADPNLGKPSLTKTNSDDAPAAPTPAAPSSQNQNGEDMPDHEKLNQALNEGTPENLNIPPEELQPSDQGQGQAENQTQTDDHGNAIPDEPNGAAPNGDGATTPEQAPDNQQDPGLATNPQQDAGAQPSGDDSADATGPAEGETGENDESEEQQQIEQNEQQQEQKQQETLDATQLNVDQIQKEKQAEAASQGKPDPTEGGKVPVDLIENPHGDPSVATPPGEDENNSESTDGDDTTGAADGTNPDDNGAGTGDGLGGDLADGAGTTGTDDGSLDDLGGQGPANPETTADGEPGVTGGDQAQAEGANAEGEANNEVNGEDAATAAAPEKAEGDELPVENQEQRPKEDEQAQQ
jgi:hypothetical protein